jgi:head-tail adaptor
MDYRHWVDAFAPPSTLSSRGQAQGAPVLLMRDIPAAIENLSGREVEVARRLMPEATLRVSIHGPIEGLSPKCYFLQHPYTTADHKNRKIQIGHIDDPKRNGFDLHCLCTEEV